MVLARLTQFGSGVKQAPVLGERVAVGHAGDKVADIARIALGRRLVAPFRRERAGIAAVPAEEIGDHAFGIAHDPRDAGMSVDARYQEGAERVEVAAHGWGEG